MDTFGADLSGTLEPFTAMLQPAPEWSAVSAVMSRASVSVVMHDVRPGAGCASAGAETNPGVICGDRRRAVSKGIYHWSLYEVYHRPYGDAHTVSACRASSRS